MSLSTPPVVEVLEDEEKVENDTVTCSVCPVMD